MAHNIVYQNKPLLTPGKNPLAVPTQALAQAIEAEWQQIPPLTSPPQARGKEGGKPLTALAYTAIDRIAGKEDAVIEALLVYVDTETLSYRGTTEKLLAARQLEQWNPILSWVQEAFGVTWQMTSGIMPIEQSPKLHKAIDDYLHGLSSMQLAAACILASGFSSLALTLAVLKGHIDADAAFRLSRLEEETQAERWGRDKEVEARAERLRLEIVAAERFLSLLNKG